MFGISRKSGKIRLKGMLDFETQDTVHVLSVIARDRGLEAMTSYASVTVHVTDVNDNAPLITFDSHTIVTGDEQRLVTTSHYI